MAAQFQMQAAQMQRQAGVMQRDMERHAARMERQAARMQHDMERQAARMQRDMERRATRMQRDMERQAEQMQAIGPTEQAFPPGVMAAMGGRGVSTSVSNGVVYVNGEPVALVPPGGPVALQNVNGTVSLNGQVVWPPAAAAGVAGAAAGMTEGAATGTEGDRPPAVRDPTAYQEAMRYSRLGVCGANRDEPCPVCLEDIASGQHTRTLPCFHFMHRHCAEAHFRRDAARGEPVLCPICRTNVGPD